MTAHRETLRRPPLPPGVTTDGGDGVYRILLHGKPIGQVVNTHRDGDVWHATLKTAPRWGWTAPTMRQAVEQLIAWREQQP